MKYLSKAPLRFAAVLLVAGLAGACAQLPPQQPLGNRAVDVDLVTNSYQATERLVGGSQQPLAMDRPILVASLVNVANLEQSSNLGRIISEQMASRLTQLGYNTKEMKLRGSFLIRQGGGEFVLSREMKEISRQQQAQAVMTGVYAVASTAVYVTVRLIRAEDGLVLASHDFRLPMGPDTLALLDPFSGIEY